MYYRVCLLYTSAFDNRPLTFPEFEEKVHQAIYVSATPGEYERSRAGQIAEQVIRPTGLLDPKVEVRPIDGQVDDLIGECNRIIERKERVLVTTLTKKMAEDLTKMCIRDRSCSGPSSCGRWNRRA